MAFEPGLQRKKAQHSLSRPVSSADVRYSALELEPKLTMATIQDLSQTELVPFLSESLKWKSMRKDFKL